MATLQEYIAYVTQNGVARSNRFQVIIPLPPLVAQSTANIMQPRTSTSLGTDSINIGNSYPGSGANDISRSLELMAESVPIPGKTINTTDIRYNGDFYKLPSTMTYSEVSMVFRLSRNLSEKNVIDQWMNVIYNPTTHELAYLNEFGANILINQLSPSDQIMHAVKLRDAFPVSTDTLSMSNESENEIMKLTVGFVYRKWERVGENESSDVLNGTSAIADSVATGSVDGLSPISNLTTPIAPPVFRTQQVANNTVLADLGLTVNSESIAIYNQLNSVVNSVVGLPAVQVNAIISQFESDVIQPNLSISIGDRTKLLNYSASLRTSLR